MPEFAVILPAAGASSRFGGKKNKLLCALGGATVLRRSIGAFLIRDDVKRIIVATSNLDVIAEVHSAIDDPRVTTCPGADSRAASVQKALLDLVAAPQLLPERYPRIDWVAVHDAARPLASQTLIDATFAAAVEHGAAAPALPITATIKQTSTPLPASIRQTIPRHNLWALQTPQFMRTADLDAAYQSCPIPLDQITDDLMLLELAGKPAWLVPGEERNIKITTPTDLYLAEHYHQLLHSK